jgi:hypothetical protein
VAGGAAGDDIVEQAVEVEAGARAERGAVPVEPPPERGPEPAARSAAAKGPPTAPAAVPKAAPAATPAARAAAAPATPPAPAPPPRDDPALAHPVVQAALRWVAADPQAGPAADPLPAVGDGRPRTALRPGAEDRPASSPGPAALRPAMVGRGEPARPPRAAPEIDLTLPLAPRPGTPAAFERADARGAAVPARSIDVHIGTIHVAVDAPPRATVQPVMAPAPPAAPARPERVEAAARSAFARLRMPRL